MYLARLILQRVHMHADFLQQHWDWRLAEAASRRDMSRIKTYFIFVPFLEIGMSLSKPIVPVSERQSYCLPLMLLQGSA
jgi:hypothetical protein